MTHEPLGFNPILVLVDDAREVHVERAVLVECYGCRFVERTAVEFRVFLLDEFDNGHHFQSTSSFWISFTQRKGSTFFG